MVVEVLKSKQAHWTSNFVIGLTAEAEGVLMVQGLRILKLEDGLEEKGSGKV